MFEQIPSLEEIILWGGYIGLFAIVIFHSIIPLIYTNIQHRLKKGESAA